jgi:hypothetical protein
MKPQASHSRLERAFPSITSPFRTSRCALGTITSKTHPSLCKSRLLAVCRSRELLTAERQLSERTGVYITEDGEILASGETRRAFASKAFRGSTYETKERQI